MMVCVKHVLLLQKARAEIHDAMQQAFADGMKYVAHFPRAYATYPDDDDRFEKM